MIVQVGVRVQRSVESGSKFASHMLMEIFFSTANYMEIRKRPVKGADTGV